MPVFNLLKPTDVNKVDLTSLENTLSNIKQQHDKNISTYNSIISNLKALPVNEVDKENLIQNKISSVTDKVNQSVNNGLYHNIGDELTQIAFDLANDKEIEQAIKNETEYQKFKKEIESSSLPQGIKDMHLSRNTFESGIGEDGVWRKQTNPVQHFDKSVIEDNIEQRIAKKLEPYEGNIFYIAGEDSEGNVYYTNSRSEAANLTPYYREGQAYKKLPMNDVYSEMVSTIYQTPGLMASIDQSIEYYEYANLNNEIPKEHNPLYKYDTRTNTYNRLTRDEYVQQLVYGHSRSKNNDYFYDSRGLLTGLNGATANNGVHIYDSNGNLISSPEIQEQLEQKGDKEEKEYLKSATIFDNRIKAQGTIEGIPYYGRNTASLFEQGNAALSALQRAIDDYNRYQPEEEKIDLTTNGFEYIEEIMKTGLNNGKSVSQNFYNAFENAKSAIKNTLSIVFSDTELSPSDKLSIFKYYEQKYGISEKIILDIFENDYNKSYNINTLMNETYLSKDGKALNYKPEEYRAAFYMDYIDETVENVDERNALKEEYLKKYKLKHENINNLRKYLSKHGLLSHLSQFKYTYSLYEDKELTPSSILSKEDYARLISGGLTSNSDRSDLSDVAKNVLSSIEAATGNLSATANNKRMYIRTGTDEMKGVSLSSDRLNYGELISKMQTYGKGYFDYTVDPANGDIIYKITKPSFDTTEYTNKPNKVTKDGDKAFVENAFNNAGLKLNNGESIYIRVSNVLETDMQQELMTQTDLKYAHKASQSKYSNISRHYVGNGKAERVVLYENGKNYYIRNNEKYEISTETLPMIFKAEDIYNNISYKYGYSNYILDDKTNLTDQEMLELSELKYLFIDILENTSINEEYKAVEIAKNIYSILNEINPKLANLYYNTIFNYE